MKNKFHSTYILLVVIVIAFILRFIFLGNVPPSPNWDEVSLGYNAYSLWETGRDEYGKFLPVVLRSYDDYKPALYAYFVIPSFLLFGLNTFAVRFPSMLFGVLTVLATYFLILEIFGKEKVTLIGRQISPKIIGVLTSLFLAISPWHIHFSRIAFESNVGLAFNVFGALFFLKGLRTHWYLLVSAFLFGINPSMYQSDKVFTPLLVLALAIIYLKQLLKIPKKFLVSSVIIGLVVLFPMVYFHFTDEQAFARAQGVSVFSDQTEFLKENVKRLEVDRQRGDVIGLVFDNRRVEFAKAIVAGYISHFDLNWLFINGDIARHHAPNMGLLYLFELPFLLIGIYQMAFGKFSKTTKWTIFSWFLLSPVPAMITSGVPHAVRTLNFLPMFQVFIAVGIIASVVAISNIRYQIAKIQLKYLIFSLSILFLLFSILFYLNQYFIQLNYETSRDWLYGYKQAIEKVKTIEHSYDKIIVSNQPPLDQSYMFFLFYLAYPPDMYQEQAANASGGFRENHMFGKYEFRPIDISNEEKSENILYIGRPGDFHEDVNKIEVVNYLDGTTAIEIVSGSNI